MDNLLVPCIRATLVKWPVANHAWQLKSQSTMSYLSDSTEVCVGREAFAIRHFDCHLPGVLHLIFIPQ